MVFGRLIDNGLKLNGQKCTFFLHKSLSYLRHVVSSEGVKNDPDKVQKVCDWPIPSTSKEVR